MPKQSPMPTASAMPYKHHAMPHPSAPLISEAWREMVYAVFESKAFIAGMLTFSASTGAIIYDAQRAGQALLEVLYIRPLWVWMVISIVVASLFFRLFAYFIYYRRYKMEPPVKITAWMISAWPSYAAWMVFTMFGANTVHAITPAGRPVIMAAAVLTILLVEFNMWGHYFYGDKDTLTGYLGRLYRSATGAARLSKGDLDGAMGVLKEGITGDSQVVRKKADADGDSATGKDQST